MPIAAVAAEELAIMKYQNRVGQSFVTMVLMEGSSPLITSHLAVVVAVLEALAAQVVNS